MGAAGFADLIGLTGFSLGVALLALAPASEETVFDGWTRGFMIAAFAVYVVVLGIDLLAYFTVNRQVEMLEGYIEMLFPVLAIFAVFAAHRQQQILDLRGTQRALKSSYDMMLTIVDQTPAGVVVLDDKGRVSFANDAAKDILDLAEDPHTGAITNPGWSVVETGQPTSHARSDFSAVLEALHNGIVPLTLMWPNGWRIDIKAAGAPLADAAGGVGGTVATFERPTMR